MKERILGIFKRINWIMILLGSLIVVSLYLHFSQNYFITENVRLSNQNAILKNDLSVTVKFINWAAKVDTTGYIREKAVEVGIIKRSLSSPNKVPQINKNVSK